MPPQGIPRKKKKRNRPVFRHGMPPQGIPRKKKEIDPFLDTVCPFRASRVINVPICDYEEEKKEIDPFLETVCPFRASRVKKKKKKKKSTRF